MMKKKNKEKIMRGRRSLRDRTASRGRPLQGHSNRWGGPARWLDARCRPIDRRTFRLGSFGCCCCCCCCSRRNPVLPHFRVWRRGKQWPDLEDQPGGSGISLRARQQEKSKQTNGSLKTRRPTFSSAVGWDWDVLRITRVREDTASLEQEPRHRRD